MTYSVRVDTWAKWESKWANGKHLVRDTLAEIESQYGRSVTKVVEEHLDLALIRADQCLEQRLSDVSNETDAERMVLKLSMIELALAHRRINGK
jgi:hypothetical protein